jgi:hypothetical protein
MYVNPTLFVGDAAVEDDKENCASRSASRYFCRLLVSVPDVPRMVIHAEVSEGPIGATVKGPLIGWRVLLFDHFIEKEEALVMSEHVPNRV